MAGPLLTEKASTGQDCPTVLALADATRANVDNNRTQPSGALGLEQARDGLMATGDALIRRPQRFDRYAWLAWAMVVVAVVGIVLVINNAFALFWLEIVVALLFVVLWTVQTFEQLPQQAAAPAATERPAGHPVGPLPTD
jgi:hypothetical protein